jgi:CelD/BcsL family acetyltransferase involved in cellulose biosynthesis
VIPISESMLLLQLSRSASPPMCSYELRFLIGEFLLGSVQICGETASGEIAHERAERVPLIRSAVPLPYQCPKIRLQRGVLQYVPQQAWRYSVSLAGPFQDYLHRFSPKTRATFRRKWRKLEERVGELRVSSFRGADLFTGFYHSAAVLSAATYQSRLLRTGLPEPSRFRDLVSASERYGGARGFLLQGKSETIAFLFCTANAGGLLYEHLGYDANYASYSPGNLLLLSALELLFTDSQFSRLDLHHGYSEQKDLFGTSRNWTGDLLTFPLSPRWLSLVTAHAALQMISRAGARLAEAFGFRGKLKRLLRHGSARNRTTSQKLS